MDTNIPNVQPSTEDINKKNTFTVSSFLLGFSAFLTFVASTDLEKVSATLLLPIFIIMGLTTVLYIYGFFLRRSSTSSPYSVPYFYVVFLILLSIQGVFAGNVSVVADYYKNGTMVWNDFLLISIAQYLFFAILVAVIVCFLTTPKQLNNKTVTVKRYFWTIGGAVILVLLTFLFMSIVQTYFFPPSDVLDHASQIVKASVIIGYGGIGSLVFLIRSKKITGNDTAQTMED